MKNPLYSKQKEGSLHGDDFSPEEISSWYEDEREAYRQLLENRPREYRYDYHALNEYHAFRHIENRVFEHALGFGSAFGHELEPISQRIQKATLLDASAEMSGHRLEIPNVKRVLARPDGRISAPKDEFDLITCFGVLHHIPNVSFVLQEFFRTIRPGGVVLIREPSTSMGDWRLERPGLTARERGIPQRWMQERLSRVGFVEKHSSGCVFPLTTRSAQALGLSPFIHPLVVRVDALFSKLSSWNQHYEPTSFWQKLGPGAAYYVAMKPEC